MEIITERPIPKDAYYVGTHRDSYRCGERSLIVDIGYFEVLGQYTLCYVVEYADGAYDYVAVRGIPSQGVICRLEDLPNYESNGKTKI